MTTTQGVTYLLGLSTVFIGGPVLFVRGMSAVTGGTGAVALAAAGPVVAVLSAMAVSAADGRSTRARPDPAHRWSTYRAPAAPGRRW